MPSAEEDQRSGLLESPLEETIRSLDKGDFAADLMQLATGSFPPTSGISTLIGQHQLQVFRERVQEFGRLVAIRLRRLENRIQGPDQAWIDLAVENGVRAGWTTLQAKRERFAYLLVNSALNPEDAQRERARTMSRILDDLEYSQVQLLFSSVTAAHGVTRGFEITHEASPYGPDDPDAIDEDKLQLDIARLTALSLAKQEIPGISQGPSGRMDSLDLVPTELGGSFLEWIEDPAPEPAGEDAGRCQSEE